MNRNGYRYTYSFFDTEAEARSFIASRPRRKHSLTPWSSTDGAEHKFVVWYYV